MSIAVNGTSHNIECCSAVDMLSRMADNSVDMCICSPPYEDARTYGLGRGTSGQHWVDWAVPLFVECVRVTKGLVAWVVEGRTSKFRWSATPVLLMADLHRAGVSLRKPPAFCRVGIPGSGGPDWWRNDYEFVVCSTKGRLAWAEPTATGHPPKYGPGGPPSHRTTATRGSAGGDCRVIGGVYAPPAKANPGNLVKCVVGGGKMGSPLAHDNEAPFPESLVEPFIKCFCPPGGVVMDVFSGSGTTSAVAAKHGRNSVACDVRQSQVDLAARRLIALCVEAA